MDPTLDTLVKLFDSGGVLVILAWLFIRGINENTARQKEQDTRDDKIDASFNKVLEVHDKSVAALGSITASFTQSMSEIRDTMRQMVIDLDDPKRVAVRFSVFRADLEATNKTYADSIQQNSTELGNQIILELGTVVTKVTETTKTLFEQLVDEIHTMRTTILDAITANKPDPEALATAVKADIQRIEDKVEQLRNDQVENIRTAVANALERRDFTDRTQS